MQEAFTSSSPQVEVLHGSTPYSQGVEHMEHLLTQCLNGGPEVLLAVEHEAVLTIGTSGNPADAAGVTHLPVIHTGRGGQVTYHGPGQQVVYAVVSLTRWKNDIRAYIRWLQHCIILTLATFNITAYAGESDEIGVWVETPTGPRKIAAIGVRVRRGTAYHGLALNIMNDLNIYTQFIPCGITGKGVTSMQALGFSGSMEEVRHGLLATMLAQIPPR